MVVIAWVAWTQIRLSGTPHFSLTTSLQIWIASAEALTSSRETIAVLVLLPRTSTRA